MWGMEWILIYGLLGLLVGFMAGLLGVGGGGILVPLLAMIFRYQDMDERYVVHYALATAFACMIFSSLASIRAHAARGNIVWNLFASLSFGILIGVFLTTRGALHIHSIYIALFFTAFMMLIAVQMFRNWQPKPGNKPAKIRHLLLVGAGIGSVSALAAVGGGFLTITYLHYKNITLKKAIGTSAAIGLPIAVAGTLGYLFSGWSETAHNSAMLGFICLPAAVAVSITSILAAPWGADLAQRLPDAHLKKIFAVVCVVLSLKMISTIL